MKKYLVIFKMQVDGREEKFDHVVVANGFDYTDFDILFWQTDFFGKKVNVALYQAVNVICIRQMDEQLPLTQPEKKKG